MIRPTAYCDECGRRKEAETNHWFVARVLIGQAFFLTTWEACELHNTAHADWVDNPHVQTLHLCSESCAVKAMSKTLAQQQ